MPRIPELNEPLNDGRAALRFAAEQDIPEVLIAHQDDPWLHVALGLGRPPSGAELGREFEQAADARAAGREVVFAILKPGSESCLGQVRARGFEWDHDRAELEVWLAPQARGRGLAGPALGLADAWLFRTCGLERLQLLCGAGDAALLNAAAAAGFRHEGTYRAHVRDPGPPAGRSDRIVLSLLASDVQARR